MRERIGRIVTAIFVASVILLGFTTTSVLAEELELHTIYHVYVDGEHVGVVEDKEIIENYKKEFIQSHQQENDFSYRINEEVSFVSEKVFSAKADNQEAIDHLQEKLTVAVEAEGLLIGDELVGYFPDQETAQEAIQAYKEQYVDAETLEQLENHQEIPNEELTSGNTIISDVSLTKEITYKDAKVSEEELLTKEDGLTLLKKGTLENKTHTVKEGEVLGAIANQYDLSLDKLKELNSNITEDSVLQIDDELHVTAYEPIVEVVVVEETLKEEELDYEMVIEESEDMYKGEKEIKQEGEKGKIEKHYQTKKVNGSKVSTDIIEENITKEPTNEKIIKGTKVIPSRGSGNFHWPAVGGSITSHVGERWGKMHKGIDIAGVSDRSILAADNGTVVSAGWDDGGYGNKIVIDHNNGYRSIYAHLSSVQVSAGQVVEKGTKIGVMGTTGRSTGIHLHFEIYKNGSRENPATFY